MMGSDCRPDLLFWLILPVLTRAFYFSKFLPNSDQCVDLKSGSGNLQSEISQFSTSFPRPVNTAGNPYRFECSGGELVFCTVNERAEKPCPMVDLQGKREVWGLIKIPPFHYTLKNCRFGEEGHEVGGDVQGKTEGADISFRVVSVGMRRICDLSPPKIQRNFVFFPEAYFTKNPDHNRSLNHQAVREAIVKSVNENLSGTIKRALNTTYDCDSFFRT